jgi:tRNA nucleotidyltransferase (CCA-adding enzyme)
MGSSVRKQMAVSPLNMIPITDRGQGADLQNQPQLRYSAGLPTSSPAQSVVSTTAPHPHPIRPPDDVVEIARRLEREGHEAWCVGGAVRDALLGHPHEDWDLATSATPDEMRRIFGRRAKPVGVEFGTVGVLGRPGHMHEVTTFRRDVRTDGRHAEVEFGASLDDDLARRDFTINAIAYHPLRRELRDPHGGRRDLERRIVRAVGDPEARMREDRLRALRALRFAGRLGFEIDPATWRAIVASAPHMGRLSAERVKQEIEKTMEQLRRPSGAIALWLDSGIMAALVPDVARTLDPRALAALDCVGAPGATPNPARASLRRLLRIALLFTGLDGAGAARALASLRFSKHDAGLVATLVERWHGVGREMGAALESGEMAGDARVRRWISALGRPLVSPAMRLFAALWAAARDRGEAAPSVRSVRALHRRLVRSAFGDPVELRDLALDGDDLRRAGIPAGPGLGKILHRLLDEVLEDPALNRPDLLLARAARLHEDGASAGGAPDDR